MRFRSHRLPAVVVLVALAALASAGTVDAQEQRASIEGTVRDSLGAPVAGAPVSAREAGGLGVATRTDGEGRYRFPSLPPGRYAVEATRDGFRPARVLDVDLSLGQLLRVDPVLRPATREESVTVDAGAPLLDVRQSARATHLRVEEIAKLPRGRDFTSLVTLAPGANAEGYWEFNGIAIDGAGGGEHRFVIDGMETTDLRQGQSGQALITDVVEEVQVKSSGYTAEYGGATGGVINVITRSGSNAWRGEVGTYYSGEWLQGRVRPFLLRMPDGSPAYEMFRKDDFDQWEPGFTLGGPLRRDRAWFFASYQPAFLATRRTVTFRADGQTGTFANANRTHNLSANLTGRLGDRTRVRAAFNASPTIEDGTLPFIHGRGPSDPANFVPVTHRGHRTMSATVDHTAADQLFLSLRVARWQSDIRQEGIHQGPRFVFARSNLGMAGVPAEFQHPRGFTNVVTNYERTRDVRTRTSLHLDGTAYATAAGRHAVKAGIQLDRLENDMLEGPTGHTVGIAWGDAFQGQRGEFGYYSFSSNTVEPERGFLTQGDVRTDNLALFLQDAWTLNDRLTLNLGLRAEREHVPSYTTTGGIPATAIGFGFGEKLAPRVGTAWDVRGDGRWKAYGSWGLFYDVMKYSTPLAMFGGNKSQFYWYTLDTPDWMSLSPPGCPPDCPGRLLLRQDPAAPLNTPGGRGIDPGLRPFRTQEAMAGLETSVGRTVSVGVRYVHKQIDHALETVLTLDAKGNDAMLIGNPGFGLARETGFGRALPKAVREYDALELTFDRRMADGWLLHASYLWSRLHGNYTGLAREAEGTPWPNNSDAFDHPSMLFGQDGQPVIGPLAFDRPHQLKAHAIREFAKGTTIGASARAMSGTPVTRTAFFFFASDWYEVPYLGRNSDGRLPVLSQVDLYVQHEFKLARGRRVQLSVNVINLFDQETTTLRYPYEFQDAADIEPAAFFRGFDMGRLAAEQGLRRDPMFLMDYGYQLPREIRLGLRFTF